MRLPIPPGAAVTRAILHVGRDLVEGAFVARDRARQIYKSITERRRDPALITWSGPDWIEASIFPVERRSRRTLELEWVEPTAMFDGSAWYRVPVIVREGGEPQRPRVILDGVAVKTPNLAWIPLATVCALVAPAAVRAPGEPFGYAFAPTQAPHGEKPRLGRAGSYDIIPGPADVRGWIDKEIIRRIVRRHMNEVKYCYETELFRSPTLAGRMAVQFTIGSTGQVISSVLQGARR